MPRTTYGDAGFPGFVADHHSVDRNGGRQIDWTLVGDKYRKDAVLVKANGAAAATDTAITVDALAGPIPIGTLLWFGSGEFAKLTAAAAAGATSLTVEALVNGIEDNDEAYYGTLGKVIKAGTIMAQLASGKTIPRAAVTGAETATAILETAALERDESVGVGYGHIVGGVIYQNLLPDFGHASFATWKGELTAAGVGTGFSWLTYADNTA